MSFTGQYLKHFLMLVTCLWLASCLQLSCNLAKESQDGHIEALTWLLWLARRFSAPKYMPSTAYPHPFLCGDAWGAAFWALHLSCAQCWNLYHYSNSLGWFRLGIFCYMVQRMLGNASALELSLYFRAGSTAQVLNNTSIRPCKQIEKASPPQLHFSLAKPFPSLPSLSQRKFISEYCWNSRSLICLPPQKQRHKRGIKDTEHANNQMFSYVEEWLLLVTHPRTRQH